MNELPPLPEPKFLHMGMGAMPHGAGIYDGDQMRAYGQQCRNEALIEAAEWFEGVAVHCTGYQIAAMLRAKVKK